MRKTQVLQALIISSALISFVLTLLIYTIDSLSPSFDLSATFYGLFSLTSFLVIGAGFHFLIYTVFNEKLKIIYRIIYDTKNPNKGKKISLTKDSIGEAYEEVSEWSEKTASELDEIKEKETFRREFVGNLSHELKTPLFTVQGYLLTLLDGGLEDQTINRKFLERAYNGVDRMTKIVDDLDIITNIESDTLKLNYSEFNLVELAKDLLDELEILAENKNITLKFGKESHNPIKVKADKHKISQALSNLINNAIYYGKENGEVIIRFLEIDKQVMIEVADNGDGISQEHLPRLFERFYRIEQSRDRNKGGSGLGLAIVKHIIESHGQSVSVRSSVGVGSTFSFTLSRV